MNRLSQPAAEWAKSVKVGTRSLTLAWLSTTTIFLGGFSAWAAYAPLDGATVAQGIVAAAGQNQMIQHLEGGIIRQALVSEGQSVTAGDILFELDPAAPIAQCNRLRKQTIFLSAQAARLAAELGDAPTLTFAPQLVADAAAGGAETTLSQQASEFGTRLALFRQDERIMRQRVEALAEQVTGLASQQASLSDQLGIVGDELARKKDLLAAGLIGRSEYAALLRSQAELTGQSGQVQSSRLAARIQIVEAEAQFARLRAQRIQTAAAELNEVQSKLLDTAEQLAAAEAVLARTKVRAPSDGIVIRMPHTTPGSVVRPGEVLLELLPTGKELMVTARVQPSDIDAIWVGQNASLRFNTVNTRSTPTVDGSVAYVSADRLVDEVTHLPYYTARLKLAEALPAGMTADQIHPGMAVEAYINTGQRTFFEYLAKPLLDSFNRAFREH